MHNRDCCAAQTLCNVKILAYPKHLFLLLMSVFLQNVKKIIIMIKTFLKRKKMCTLWAALHALPSAYPVY